MNPLAWVPSLPQALTALPWPQAGSIWQGLRSLFVACPAPQMLTMAQLINQQQDLQASLTAQMLSAGASVAPHRRQQFAARAAAMVSDVVADSMYPVHTEMMGSNQQTVSSAHFQAAADQARAFAVAHQAVALSLQPMQDDAPQLQDLGAGRFLLLRAAPAIENLVLSGGGAKGVAYAPALRALENLGLLAELKQVAGSSAGAMAAVLLASGMSPKALQQTLNGTAMLSLLTTPADFAAQYPRVKFGSLGFGGGTALQEMDRLVARSVGDYLTTHWTQITQQAAWAQFTPQVRRRLESLCRPDFSIPRSDQMVTFSDLHWLRQLDPARFKDLVVTGWEQTHKRLGYFSHQTTPDMALALAARISMGIPVLFADVIRQERGQEQRWADGGVGSNVPSEVLFQGLSGQALEHAHTRTLVLVTFTDLDQTYAIMHGPPGQRTAPTHPVVTWLSGNPRLPEVESEDRRKIHAAGLQAMPLSHGDLGLGSFHASAARVARAKVQALHDALQYIAQHRHNYRHDVVSDVDAAAALLSLAEQDQFLARHPDDRTALEARLCAAIEQQRAAQEPGAAAWQAAALAWASRTPARSPL